MNLPRVFFSRKGAFIAMTERNLTMLTDFYEFTMANGYFEKGMGNRRAYFDMFFRRVPDGGGYAIMAGVEQLISYFKNLRFTEEDIAYLRRRKCFSEAFLNYLRDFKFECDVWAVPEGTPVFPGEPLVTVAGPMIQAQFVETMVLLTVNHQTLIATKANRITRAAQGRTVLEFGSRRAQGYDGAIYGARATFIGGCQGTACVLADRDHGIPAGGTMAHSWVQMFDSEYEAFKAYAEIYPDNCVFLVDTYNVLKSGVPNAIRVAKELAEKGIRAKGIRLDSGDIAYLSVEARKMLNDAGFSDMQIMASNSLDEYLVRDLIVQGAQIDSFGIGERLITSKSEPVFGGVYKLAAVENEDGEIIPKIKVSENVEKITTPHFKQVYRLFDNKTGKALGDVLTFMTRSSIRLSPMCSSTRSTPGSSASLPTTPSVRCASRSSRTVNASISRPRSPRSATTACARWIRSGIRSSASRIRRPTLSTCPKSSGPARTSCSNPAASDYIPTYT